MTMEQDARVLEAREKLKRGVKFRLSLDFPFFRDAKPDKLPRYIQDMEIICAEVDMCKITTIGLCKDIIRPIARDRFNDDLCCVVWHAERRAERAFPLNCVIFIEPNDMPERKIQKQARRM